MLSWIENYLICYELNIYGIIKYKKGLRMEAQFAAFYYYLVAGAGAAAGAVAPLSILRFSK